ncbi:hypothetical protein PENTCL1PPCAC_8128 [Pristionchus entomophagus]|uniref:Uncharacterized protein n=1 Tax=Pristionchus entomophagus TaxID=358040 RepID=A0AAV5SSX3_9BILA|nr:hypothetical protein PENTCL1PPCAC_8128 [Pristionchus entomophagus]
MNRQYRGELELSFRTLGSIGINGGRILIRYVRLPLDAEKLEEIERSINGEKRENERLERRFETAKKENEARQRREEEEDKQIERLREEEERRQRGEEEAAATQPPVQMSIPDRLPAGPPMAASDDGWAFDSPSMDPPPTVPSMAPPRHRYSVILPLPLYRLFEIESLEALLHNVSRSTFLIQELSSRSDSSAIGDTVDIQSCFDILRAGRMETEENTEPLPERCERRAVFFKK